MFFFDLRILHSPCLISESVIFLQKLQKLQKKQPNQPFLLTSGLRFYSYNMVSCMGVTSKDIKMHRFFVISIVEVMTQLKQFGYSALEWKTKHAISWVTVCFCGQVLAIEKRREERRRQHTSYELQNPSRYSSHAPPIIRREKTQSQG